MKIKPFKGIRPPKELVEQVSSRPYDVLNSEEARQEAAGNAMSLYHIIKPEINFEPGTDEHDPKVYGEAKQQYQMFKLKGWLVQDQEEKYYVYAQTILDRDEAAQREKTASLKEESKEIVKPDKKSSHSIVLTDENLGKEYMLSHCCHPIPGDEVLGYLDEKGMMHIHKIDCPEAALLKTSYGKRLYAASWNTHRVQSFVETIELKGIDKFGVFIQVLQTISTDFHINMRAINISSDDGIFQGTMEIYVYDKSELEALLKAIRKNENIKEVRRIVEN